MRFFREVGEEFGAFHDPVGSFESAVPPNSPILSCCVVVVHHYGFLVVAVVVVVVVVVSAENVSLMEIFDSSLHDKLGRMDERYIKKQVENSIAFSQQFNFQYLPSVNSLHA